jgi:hypothetical protein
MVWFSKIEQSHLPDFLADGFQKKILPRLAPCFPVVTPLGSEPLEPSGVTTNQLLRSDFCDGESMVSPPVTRPTLATTTRFQNHPRTQ